MWVGGPWTPAVVPEAHRSVEATMGTVMFVDIPEDRKDLREKFHPKNMPVWRFIQGEGDGYVVFTCLFSFHPNHRVRAYEGGGFPITREGRLKFGFRARKVYSSF